VLAARLEDLRGERSWHRGIRVTFLAAAAGLVFLALFGGDVEEGYGLGSLFALRGRAPPPPEIVLVAIDRASAESLKLPFPPPWPRTAHANLAKALTERGAKAIIVDLYFDEEREVPGRAAETQVLADAIRPAGNVALLQRMVRGTGANADRDELIDPAQALRDAAVAVAPFPLPVASTRLTRFWTFRAGTPTMASVALQLASSDLAPDWAAVLKSENLGAEEAQAWKDRRVVSAMAELRRQLLERPGAATRLRDMIARLEPEKARRLSALLALYLGEDTRLINFLGPPGTVRTISFASVIDGTASAADIRDKIVFVGFDERGFVSTVDSYKTAYADASGIDLSGVEILATGVANLAADATLKSSALLNLLVIVFTALVAGAVAALSRRMDVILIAAGSSLAAIFVLGYATFVSQHLVIPLITPSVELVFGFFLTAAFVSSAERKLRLSLERAARQWLPGDVVENVLAHAPSVSGPLPGVSHFAICLASDVQGFTATAERLPLATLDALMKEYFQPAFAAVRRYQGAISNIAGDGMLCAWKADTSAREARANALNAAIETSTAVEEFNRRHPATPFPTRFGVHAGEVAFSAVGGSGHYVATVVGDVANAVSRIESLNRELHTRILASEEALTGIDGFAVRRLGAFLVEGRSQPIRIAEILGVADDDAHAAELIDAFGWGLAAFDEERWGEAAERFESLNHAYPGDGPISYFLKLAKDYTLRPPSPGTGRPIRVSVK
jgi:adenylate cyclase